MKVLLRYDRHADAWTVLCDDVFLKTSQDIAEWKQLLHGELQTKLGAQRAYVLVDMQGFSVHPAVATEYGQVARDVALRYTLGVIRYGNPGRDTLTHVRLQAVVNRLPANICADRKAALSALARMRTQQRETPRRALKSAPGPR